MRMGRRKVCHITTLAGARPFGDAELTLIAAPDTSDGAADAPQPKGKKSAHQAAMEMDKIGGIGDMIAGAQAFASKMYQGDGMKRVFEDGNKNGVP